MSKTCESAYPKVVNVYRQRYHKMAKPEYLRDFRHCAKAVLKDPIEGLDWKALLSWEHQHLEYTREQLPKRRAEMPMAIIKQAKGRCGEFALLYNGLLLADAYRCRIVIDCSALHDKSKAAAGDHVWNEVRVDGGWMHVDPTERRINQPLMYAQEWNKDVNLVYAITKKAILEVTETYRIRT
ncbi:MAG: transglutaminase domain-containing protein [Candidatus Bathyarchaeia archaeon]